MKIIFNHFVIIIIIIYVPPMFASIGCMENSYHVDGREDFKQYHYVECTCPCQDVIAWQGVCRVCNHRGSPNRGVINAMQELPFEFD